MARKKPGSTHKRKRKGFFGVRPWEKPKDDTVGDTERNQQTNKDSTATEQLSTPVGASMHKLSDRGFSTDDSDVFSGVDDQNDSSSYRLVDVNLLSATLSEVHKCPEGLLQFYVL